MLTNERAEAESMVPEACFLEEHVQAAEEDSESLRLVPVRVDKLMAEQALFAPETEQSKARHDTLADLICSF